VPENFSRLWTRQLPTAQTFLRISLLTRSSTRSSTRGTEPIIEHKVNIMMIVKRKEIERWLESPALYTYNKMIPTPTSRCKRASLNV